MLQPTLPAGFIAPCLPTKTDKLPSGSQWLHEIKHDGFRIIARKNGAQVRLYSRPGNDLTHRFPLIVDTLARLLSRSCIIDGEAVAYNDSAVASFDLVRHARANDSMCIGVALKWGACPVVAMTPTDNHGRRPPPQVPASQQARKSLPFMQIWKSSILVKNDKKGCQEDT